MDSYEILEREAVMNAYVRETGERITMLETCLDDVVSKLARICQSDLTDQRVMRGLLDQTRMVTSTIRGYDQLIEMRMNMQAHEEASRRHIAKLRAEEEVKALLLEKHAETKVPATEVQKNKLPDQRRTNPSLRNEKNYHEVPQDELAVLEEVYMMEKTPQKRGALNQARTANSA